VAGWLSTASGACVICGLASSWRQRVICFCDFVTLAFVVEQNMGNRYAQRIKIYLSFALFVTFVFLVILVAEYIGSVRDNLL
jgi:hypothetical protein